MNLGGYWLQRIQFKGLIGIDQCYRNYGCLGFHGAFKSTGQEIMHFVPVAVVAALGKNNDPTSLLYLPDGVKDSLHLLFHISLVKPDAFEQGNKLGGDKLVGPLIVNHDRTGRLVG